MAPTFAMPLEVLNYGVTNECASQFALMIAPINVAHEVGGCGGSMTTD